MAGNPANWEVGIISKFSRFRYSRGSFQLNVQPPNPMLHGLYCTAAAKFDSSQKDALAQQSHHHLCPEQLNEI